MNKHIFLLFIFLESCLRVTSPSDDGHSGINQIVEKAYQCKIWDAERIKIAQEKAAAFSMPFNNGASPFSQKYFNGMAGIPDKYLDWMSERVATNRFRVELWNGGGWSMTSWGNRDGDKIQMNATDSAFDQSLQHEVGHYVMLYVEERGVAEHGLTQQQFNAELKQVADLSVNNPNLNWYPKSYLQTNPPNYQSFYMEFWAEAFNSYYCSEEANKNFAETFPETYTFVSKYLEPPVWDQIMTTSLTHINTLLYTDKRTPNQVSAYFAGPKNMTAMTICAGTKEDCESKATLTVNVPVAKEQTGWANFFVMQNMQAAANAHEYYLRGLDTQGSVLFTRELKIEQK